LAHLQFCLVLLSLLLLRTGMDFPLRSLQADNLKAQAVCAGTWLPHRLQVIRPTPSVNLPWDRLPACQARRLAIISLTLPREAALLLRGPERKRRNSHTETLHGVYPERSRRVQGGRRRPSWSFARRSRGIRET
jgi:hypothetical protein